MKQGFTLLELSIVLVIIGLIIGGVTVGSQMIRSAELNSVISDVNKYKTAIQTFKLKYNALPGDMPNATDYWGDDSTICADATITDGTPGTCNGSGDGNISFNVVGGTPISEQLRAWEHLSLAGMITGTYHNTGSTAMTAVDVGVNIPAASIEPGGFLFTTRHSHFGRKNKNQLWLAAGTSTFSFDSIASFPLSAMYGIDRKMDDGRAATGDVYGYNTNSMGAGVAADHHCVMPHQNSDLQAHPPNVTYNLKAENALCRAYFNIW